MFTRRYALRTGIEKSSQAALNPSSIQRRAKESSSIVAWPGTCIVSRSQNPCASSGRSQTTGKSAGSGIGCGMVLCVMAFLSRHPMPYGAW